MLKTLVNGSSGKGATKFRKFLQTLFKIPIRNKKKECNFQNSFKRFLKSQSRTKKIGITLFRSLSKRKCIQQDFCIFIRHCRAIKRFSRIKQNPSETKGIFKILNGNWNIFSKIFPFFNLHQMGTPKNWFSDF